MSGKETVRDIMSKKVISVLPGDSALEAARAMEENNIGALPVVSAGELKGMLTDRDIVLRCVAVGKNPSQVCAGDIMTKQVVFLTSGQPVSDAASMMEIEQVRRLPVVDNGIVQGMVSVADLTRRVDHHEIAEVIGKISDRI